eukprot:scaffold139_cov260-Ochromonas_danica.AAC.13
MSEEVSSSINNNPHQILIFKGLGSHMFAHPEDIQVTSQLASIPWIESWARTLFSTLEEILVVDNLASTVRVGPNQMASLHQSLVKACAVLDMDIPDLYVKQNPLPNAYTFAYQGRRPFIVIHTGLLDLLNEEEMLAVLGHELGHLKCEHGLWLTLLSAIASVADSLSGSLLPIKPLLLKWQQAAEYTCDRASLLVVGDYRIVASVLMKLCGGSTNSDFSKDLNVDAFLKQAEQLEKERMSLVGFAFSVISQQVDTHPVPLLRAINLVRWSHSAQYSGLRRRAIQRSLPMQCSNVRINEVKSK